MRFNAHRIAIGVRAPRYASLRSQIIRSAISIPANIVEGRRQDSERDFARFLHYSLNSAYELEYHLMLARDMEVIADAEASALLAALIEVRKILHGEELRSSRSRDQRLVFGGRPSNDYRDVIRAPAVQSILNEILRHLSR